MGIRLNSTGMVTGWFPTKIVQMVPIGCILSKSWGQKIGFQNAFFFLSETTRPRAFVFGI